VTDGELAVHTVAVNRIESAARDEADVCEREAMTVVVRQAVALRKALEQLIVTRAIQATLSERQGT